MSSPGSIDDLGTVDICRQWLCRGNPRVPDVHLAYEPSIANGPWRDERFCSLEKKGSRLGPGFLPLGVLEPLASAGLSVLFALLRAGVAGEVAALLQNGAALELAGSEGA